MKCILVISFVLLLSSCFTDDAPLVELEVYRFENYLFTTDSANIFERLKNWNDDVGHFSEVFDAQIMGRQQMTDTAYAQELLAFITHPDMREAYDSVVIEFADFSTIEQDLQNAFGQFSICFPDYEIPSITTFFGGFTYGVSSFENNVAIGLEHFLGEKSKFYNLLSHPEYLKFQKQKRFIVPNVMEVWCNRNFQHLVSGRDFLSQMIYKGKVMYFINTILPNTLDADKFRFTDEQMQWVIENEATIWTYFIEQDLLFSYQEKDYRSLLNYSPFAKGMPQDAPARVAYYIGYKMIEQYMNTHDITVEELMFLTDSKQLLQESKYKPTR